MKEHAYFFGSRSVLVRENQKQFCSCSVLVLEQEQVREHVLEQLACSFIPAWDYYLSIQLVQALNFRATPLHHLYETLLIVLKLRE